MYFRARPRAMNTMLISASQQQVADLQRALDMNVTADELDRLEIELLRLADAAVSSSPPAGSAPPVSQVRSPSLAMQNVRVLTEQDRRQALAMR